MGLFSSLFGGHKEKTKQLPTMNPQQLQLLQQILGGLTGQGGGGGPLGEGFDYLSQILSGDPEALKEFEAPYMRQFQEQTVPGLAERFSSLGSGAQGSSAFGQALGSAGAGLSENLAAMRGGLKQNALSQLMNFSQMGMGAQPFAYQHTPARPGFFGSLMPGIGSGIGMGMGSGLSRLFGM